MAPTMLSSFLRGNGKKNGSYYVKLGIYWDDRRRGNGREKGKLPDKPLFVFFDAAAMLVLSSWQRILRCKDLYADRTYWRTA